MTTTSPSPPPQAPIHDSGGMEVEENAHMSTSEQTVAPRVLLDKLVSAVFRFEEKATATVLSKSANFKSAPRSAGFQLLALVQRAVQKNGLCSCCQELCAPRQERARASEWCRRRLCGGHDAVLCGTSVISKVERCL